MAPTFIVYVDESGDEGFNFNGGSSEWFVLSAVVVRKSVEPDAVKVLDRVRNELGKKPDHALHFRKLTHDQRVLYATRLAEERRFRALSVLVHKPSLRSPETFSSHGHRLYFYTARYLIERISWLCRDSSKDAGDGSAEIIFSNRSGMSYDDLKAYLDRLKERRDGVSIDWDVVRTEQVRALPHDQRRGLQIVDAVASSKWYGLNPNHHGFVEDRYARIIEPIVYRRKGGCRGYGMKFWPREAENGLASEARYEWVRQLYGR